MLLESESRAESRVDAVLKALERAWAEIHWRHPDVPHVVAEMASASDGRQVRCGHLVSGRWLRPDGGLTELLVDSECLGLEPRGVLGALLHEAAHGVASVRGIRDVSESGRYHNARYRALALELGLDCARSSSSGWSFTEVPDSLAARYRGTVRRLAIALGSLSRTQALPAPGRPGGRPGEPASSAYALLMCPCDRRIRMSLGVLAQGPILCQVCGDEFAPVV